MPTHTGNRGQALLLVLTIAFTASAVVLLSRDVPAQAVGTAGNPGLIVVPIMLTPKTQGLALIDTKYENICIYEINTRAPAHERLVLVAARTFRYDTQLEDYNTAAPHPAQVRAMLQDLDDDD